MFRLYAILSETFSNNVDRPDSLVFRLRVSASGAEGRGFAPRTRHTKGVKNGTSSSLADDRIKKVVLGR